MNDDLVISYSLYFLRRVWPHAPRNQEERDQGFERKFREHIWCNLRPEILSTAHDLSFAGDLTTLTGLRHEIDLIARWGNEEWVFELKNGGGTDINKEMLMVFNEKVLDFYMRNYGFLSGSRIMRCFLTGTSRVEEAIRAYCATWGIVLVDNEMLPIPLLPQAFSEKRQQLMDGKLADVDEEEVSLAERAAWKLVEQTCKPLGNLIELSDLSEQLTVRLDRMTSSGIALAREHRRLYDKYRDWLSIVREAE